MRRIVFGFLACLTLAGCGSGRGGEDFSVVVERPADRVLAALDGIRASDKYAELFPGVKVDRSRPGDGEVLYTIPGTGSFDAALRFRVVAVGGNKGAVIHAAIDVPSVRTNIAGKSMVLSESKVEHVVKGLLESAARKLAKGQSIERERQDLSELFLALGVVTDKNKLKLAEAMRDNPEWYSGGFSQYGSLSDADADAETPDAPYGEAPTPASDPQARVRANERTERDRLEQAAEPQDDAEGEKASGDSTQPDSE